jgi:CheY-like chemotaxis protein
MVMKQKLNCILLVDDDKDFNFIHERLLKKMNCVESIEVAANGKIGLDFIMSNKCKPNIIFLDINMPKMNGWEFLEAYNRLAEDEKANVVIVMLTSSLNPDDMAKAETFGCVRSFVAKPLDIESVEKILIQHFAER